MERAKAGMLYTGAGLAAAGAVGLGVRAVGPSNIWGGARRYGSLLKSNYQRDVTRLTNTGLDQLTRSMGGPVSPAAYSRIASSARFKALPAFATVPVMAGAGALLGAAFAGEDHRMRGAAIGAGVGAGASVALHAAKSWKSMGKAGAPAWNRFGMKPAMAVALAAAAFGAGSAMRPKEEVAALPTETGEAEYADMAAAQRYDSGAGRRMRSMKASGDMVFGMSNSRHG
jgi:hypothetical protein